MRTHVGFVAVLSLLLIACNQSSNMNEQGLSELAVKGKAVFEKHECSKCHYIGDEEIQSEAPDLTNPFLANDTQFVQTHLRFVEESKMPPVSLTKEEVRLLSFYVAELHRTKYARAVENADRRCPVCYAPVSRDQAVEQKMYRNYRNMYYYFECEKCLKTFEKAPQAFSESAQDLNLTSRD